MPQVVAWAAAAIASALVPSGIAVTTATVAGISTITATAYGATATAIAAAAIEAAAYVGIAALTAPKVAAADGRPSEWSADPDAPIPFIFGLRGVAGQIVHRDTFGPDNRYQGIVTVYSGAGPVNGYGDFWVDGTVKTFTGEQMDGTPAKLWRQTKLGAQPDTALTSPATLPSAHSMTGWGSSHKLSGKACSMITLFQDGDFRRWPTGEPKVIQEVQGVLCYDPRLDSTYPGGSGTCRLATRSTWVYSTNGAIHALNWALGMKENSILVGGIGASIGAIDVDALIAAANVADTNGWTCSAVAYSLDDKFQVYAGLLQTAGAIPARTAGKISCVSRAAAPSSIVTISADDTAGPFEFQAGAPREGRINTAIPRCVSSTHDWEMVDLSPVSNSTYVTEDGGATRSRGIDYAYVSDADQAAQLARYDIADSREGITGTISLKPYLRDLDPGDCFTITEDGFGLSGQKCLVLSRSFDPATGLVQVTFRSETNAKHAWALSGTGTLPSTPSLGYTDPTSVTTPSSSDWALAAGTGGVPSLVLTGAVPSSVNTGKIIVEYKTAAASIWNPVGEFGPDTTRVEVPGLTANTSYVLGVTYRNVQGVPGSRLSLSAVTTGYVAGGGVATGTVDTTQLAAKAAHQISNYYTDTLASQTSQSLATNFGNQLASITITTTGEPVEVEVFVTEEVSNNAEYYYYLHLDNTFSVVASNEVNHKIEWALKSGNTNTFKHPRSWKVLITGVDVAAGSHTFRLYLRNTSGSNIDVTSRYMSVLELKKST